MRWERGRRSHNVEDRRAAGRTRMPLGRGLKGGGLGTIVLVLVAMYFGVDPTALLQGGGGSAGMPLGTETGSRQSTPQEDRLAEFVSVVLGDTEDTWHAIFQKMGKTYEEPKLVLFSGSIQSACGLGQAAMGPFYCPGDHKVYIDLSFYDDLKRRFKAPGDFAQAYVIAHEVGHHVQSLLGISEKVHAQRRRLDKVEGNQLSVRQELQADCLAGIWAHHAHKARQVLEEGDIDEALGAATAIGDDRLQKQSQGYVSPDSFTHGSSAQRVRWFKTGLTEGRMTACNTFQTDAL